MKLVILKVWLLLLFVLDLMLIFQLLARIVLFAAGKTARIDWTRYNIIMLSLLAVSFLPVTAAVLYIRR